MPTKRINVVGIVPAAGRSTRMGTPKQLLPVDGVPMAMAVARALLAGGCQSVVLATRRELIDAFGPPPPEVACIVNDDEKAEMIDTVRIAIHYWQAKQQGDQNSASAPDAYLFCPGDAAGVGATDVQRCLRIFSSDPTRIVVASHGQQCGHPLVIPASLAADVLSSTCDAGLNRLLHAYPERVERAPCESPGVLSNINEPGDWRLH